MIKIAISGKAKSGKNTLANLIAEELSLNKNEYFISAFANKIKKLITEMFPGCDLNALYGSSELRQSKINCYLSKYIEIDASYRDVCLDIGKIGRKYSPKFWIAHIAHEYNALSQNQIKCYMIADQRFEDELKWVKDNNFILIRMKREDIFKIDDISETDQDKVLDDKFDFVIENNGSIQDLRVKVKDIVKALIR